jgi:hypothetical protein
MLKSVENIGLRFGLRKTTSMSLITPRARMSPNGMIYLLGKYMSLFPSNRFLKNSRFILERAKLNGAGDPNTGLTADSIQELDAQFCTLSKDVLSLAIETFNRFVDFARYTSVMKLMQLPILFAAIRVSHIF